MTNPNPIHRRRTPRVTEETPGPGYTCPTPCDDDCDAPCHEAHAADIDRHHPVDICEANVARGKPPIPVGWYPTGCSCLECDKPYWPTLQEMIDGLAATITAETPRPPLDDENPRLRTRMTLCPVCGFKRCPGAADHRNRCTGSNAVGQEGSLYAPDPPISEEERQRRRAALDEMNEILGDERDNPRANTPIHTRGPLEGQPIVPETEQEKRERYLANRDDPKEWG